MLKKISLGTAQFGLHYGINNKKGQVSELEVVRILKRCNSLGINCIDTASAYGSSESILGKVLSENFSPGDFEITTKFKFDINQDFYSLTDISLQRLRLKKIDAQLFHSFEDYMKFSGCPIPNQIDKIGVSVYTNEEISQVIKDRNIQIIQCPFNLLDNDTKRGDLLRLAKKKGIEVQVRSVFLQGLFFTDRDNLPNNLLDLRPYLNMIDDYCNEFNLTIEELAIGYCFSKDYIDKIVLGVDSLEQLNFNIAAIKKEIPKSITDLIDKIAVERIDMLNPVNW